MTQEDKEILLKDLCARLPYGVKISVNNNTESLQGINVLDNIVEYGSFLSSNIEEVKPYLFPLSSMTEEQEDEWYEVFVDPLSKKLDRHTRQEDLQLQADAQAFGIEYLLKNHFDIYGLIPMGLAIDATNLNIY